MNSTESQLAFQTGGLPDLDSLLDDLGGGTPANAFESQQIDFKRPAGAIKETLQILADASVCFANADGGRIVLGIDDRATAVTATFVGVEPGYSLDVVRKGIFDRTQPSLTVHVAERYAHGARLLIIDVPPGAVFHSNTAGLATRRLGTECRPFPPEQQRDLLAARGQFDWSAQGSGLSLDDLSAAEFERMRRLLTDAGREELAQLRDASLLEAMRLIAADGTATNAAVLLLAPEHALNARLPTHGYSYQYRPSPGRESTHRLRGAKPLLAATETLLDLVDRRVEIQPLNTAAGVQLQLTDYPHQAVREIIVNALLHRSYETQGSVDIEHSPERLTITSPGGLVAGVAPENILTHPSTPRHRLLAEAISLCQLAERTGQGIDRAYREMLRAGKSPPSIADLGLLVRTDLIGGIGNDAFVRYIRDLPDDLSSDVDVLIALSLLRTSTSIDAHHLAPVIQRGPSEAQEVLARLADNRHGILEPTRRSVQKPFPSYRLRNEPLADLARAVSYRRHTLDDIDAKVVEHVAEYGFVTNRTIQRLFDLHVYAARDMLVNLRERGLISKIGTARGGPGVKYGPGPKFPKRARGTR